MLDIISIPVGPFQANCHLVLDEETRDLLIVDPGDEPTIIAGTIERLKARPVAIWNTHAHIDHVNGNAALKARYGVPLSIHRIEADWLGSPVKTLAAFAGIDFHPSSADVLWEGGETVEALGREWRIYHTPGHSPGSCTIACGAENVALVGDLVMAGSIGRMDLPGGDPNQMQASLRGMFQDWGRDSWRLFSGHGEETTLGEERRSNYLVQQALDSGF